MWNLSILCKGHATSYLALHADKGSELLNVIMRPVDSVMVRLRCDREQPCSNCAARNVDCKYGSSPGSRNTSQARTSRQQLDARLHHLESLVSTIASRPSRLDESALEANREQSVYESSRDRSHLQTSYDHSLDKSIAPGGKSETLPGRLIANENQTIYVSASHWTAICDEVC